MSKQVDLSRLYSQLILLLQAMALRLDYLRESYPEATSVPGLLSTYDG